MASDISFADGFPAANDAQWRKLVDGVLKGESFDQVLTAKTADGLMISPLYARAPDRLPIAGRAPAAPWQILQRADHPRPDAANIQVLQDLENGATGLSLIFDGAIGAHGYGLDASEDALAQILDGVYLDAGAPLEFVLSASSEAVPAYFAKLLRSQRLSPKDVNAHFGFDPIGAMALNGGSPLSWAQMAPLLATHVSKLAAAGFKGPFAVADARVVHDAGGSEAQELAFALATAIAYLRALEAGGIALDTARKMVFFRLSADADQFLTLTKFRALRELWARVEESCGLIPAPIFISAETAWRMLTKRDANVNMLRTTIAAFSAGLGGADAISVLPHTAAYGLPDALARRLGRNTQLILQDEAHLAKVSDPAAGSGGMEDLTDKLCRATWTLFQEIEKNGGIAASLEKELIQKKVAAVRVEREAALQSGKTQLVGTTIFSAKNETGVSILDVRPRPPVAPSNVVTIPALTPIRLSFAFEQDAQA